MSESNEKDNKPVDQVLKESQDVISTQEEEKPRSMHNEVYWENNQLIVQTRSGKTYKFEEQEGSIIEDAAKSSTIKKQERGGVVSELRENLMYNKLIVKSCVSPVLKESDFEINRQPGSETVALKKAMMQLYDIQSFLN